MTIIANHQYGDSQRGLTKPIECPRCPMHFENDEALLEHLKERHNI